VSDSRLRPALHFTADHGWTNDPHGIVHVDGRYHMFFQYNPDDVRWNEACQWGQAESDDLVVWREVDVALAPEQGEIGCWSGSAVIDDGGPVLAYTRIAHDDWGRGAVALARPRRPMADWHRTPSTSVLDGPPDGLDITAFRDPQIRCRGDGWVAVIGAGLVGYGGCALQYGVSADLTEWAFEGVLASRSNDDREPVWSGKVWECPQFLQVDGHWTLLVSVWEDDVLHNVVYALGDYDGTAFEPRTWGTFSHGPQLYATTTFVDDEGRPCAMSWMREQGSAAPEGSPWCSAMSLPHRLAVVDGRLLVTQHPALDRHLVVELLRGPIAPGSITEVALAASAPWRLTADVASGDDLVVDVPDAGWRLRLDAGAGRAVISTDSDDELLVVPGAAGVGGELDLVVDADILELTWAAAEGIAAVRVPASAGSNPRAVISSAGGAHIAVTAGRRG
jgi:beta-fructofuranosidase